MTVRNTTLDSERIYSSVEASDRPQGEAVINLDAIAHNVEVLRRHAGDAAVMAVVKADGYNHGATEVAMASLRAGAREIGVTTVAEAKDLRRQGVSAPILCWLNTVDADFAGAITAGIEIGVPSVRHLRAVAKSVAAAQLPATVSIKVDTGLNRNGSSPEDYPMLLDELKPLVGSGTIRLRGIFSHLATADDPSSSVIDLQRARFHEALRMASVRGLEPEVTHLANSAATLTRPDLRFDMVRTGIALYGLSPLPELDDFGLRPAMTLRTRVVLVKKVAAGEGVSYGHRWIAPRDTVVALLPLGYADGIPRALSGKLEVAIGGARHKAVGRVCMDQVVIDLGPDGSGVSEGDTAILFGDGSEGESHAQDWARALDTIHYEIVTSPRGRVARLYTHRSTDGTHVDLEVAK